MQKLADISVFESIQGCSNERMQSPMSVFNDSACWPGVCLRIDDNNVSVYNANPQMQNGVYGGMYTQKMHQFVNDYMALWNISQYMTDPRMKQAYNWLFNSCKKLFDATKLLRSNFNVYDNLVKLLGYVNPQTQQPMLNVDKVIGALTKQLPHNYVMQLKNDVMDEIGNNTAVDAEWSESNPNTKGETHTAQDMGRGDRQRQTYQAYGQQQGNSQQQQRQAYGQQQQYQRQTGNKWEADDAWEALRKAAARDDDRAFYKRGTFGR